MNNELTAPCSNTSSSSSEYVPNRNQPTNYQIFPNNKEINDKNKSDTQTNMNINKKHFFNILLSCLGQFEDDVEHAVAGLNYVLQPDHARVVDSLQ